MYSWVREHVFGIWCMHIWHLHQAVSLSCWLQCLRYEKPRIFNLPGASAYWNRAVFPSLFGCPFGDAIDPFRIIWWIPAEVVRLAVAVPLFRFELLIPPHATRLSTFWDIHISQIGDTWRISFLAVGLQLLQILASCESLSPNPWFIFSWPFCCSVRRWLLIGSVFLSSLKVWNNLRSLPVSWQGKVYETPEQLVARDGNDDVAVLAPGHTHHWLQVSAQASWEDTGDDQAWDVVGRRQEDLVRGVVRELDREGILIEPAQLDIARGIRCLHPRSTGERWKRIWFSHFLAHQLFNFS